MVGPGPRFFDVGNGTQLFDNLTFEIATLVTIETHGKIITTNETFEKKSGHVVLAEECLSTAGEIVRDK